MKFNRGVLAIIAAIVLLVSVLAGGLLLADEPLEVFALQVDDDRGEDEAEGEDEPITGEALEQASAAALDYLGEGRVTDTEVGDEEGYYEVEVTLDNGRQVDVHLDESFNVIGEEAEEEDEADDEDEAEDADEDDSIAGSVAVSQGTENVEALAKISADEAAQVALAEYPDAELAEGTELEVENGFLVYEVELDNGMEIIVDAGNGEILHSEMDD